MISTLKRGIINFSMIIAEEIREQYKEEIEQAQYIRFGE